MDPRLNLREIHRTDVDAPGVVVPGLFDDGKRVNVLARDPTISNGVVTDARSVIQSILSGSDPLQPLIIELPVGYDYLIEPDAEFGVEVDRDDVAIVVVGGPWARLTTTAGETIRNIRVQEGVSNFAFDGLWFVRDNNSGACVRLDGVHRVWGGRIGCEGALGGTVSSQGGNTRVAINEILGYSRGGGAGGASGAHPRTGDEDWQIGRIFMHEAQEAFDSFGVKGFQIGLIHTVDCDSSCELSSSEEVTVAQIIHRGAGASGVVVVKNEINNRPNRDIVFADIDATDFENWLVNVQNSQEAGGDPDLFSAARISFGVVRGFSEELGSKGFKVVASSDDGRPRTVDVTVDTARIYVEDQALQLSRADDVTIKDGVFLSRDPTDQDLGVYTMTARNCDRLRGRIEVRSWNGRVARLDDCPDADVDIVQRLDPARVESGSEARPSRGVSLQRTAHGRVGVALEDVRGYGLNLSDIDQSALTPGQKLVLALDVQRSEEGLQSDSATHDLRNVELVPYGGADRAYVYATDERAVRFQQHVARLAGRVRVRSDAVTTSAMGAFHAQVGECDLDVEVEQAEQIALRLALAGEGPFRFRMAGNGDIGGDAVRLVTEAEFDEDGSLIHGVVTALNYDGRILRIEENHDGEIRGFHFELQGGDTRATAKATALQLVSNSGLATLLTNGFLSLAMSRRDTSPTGVIGESLIDGDANDPAASGKSVTYLKRI